MDRTSSRRSLWKRSTTLLSSLSLSMKEKRDKHNHPTLKRRAETLRGFDIDESSKFVGKLVKSCSTNTLRAHDTSIYSASPWFEINFEKVQHEETPLSPRALVRSCIKEAERQGAIQSSYDYYGTVGKGSFGKVSLVHQHLKNSKHGESIEQTYAVKVCSKKKGRKQLQMARLEARILVDLPPHPFIVKLSHCIEDDNNVYLALEYCSGGDLFAHLRSLGTLPERVARQILSELVLALGHLHRFGIMHRDVKPENVLIDSSGHVRLTDFGLSTLNVTQPDFGAVSLCGSPGYLAPEVLAGRGYGFAADWWQLGMVLLEVTTGKLPWSGKSLSDIANAFNHVRLETPAYLSMDASTFLAETLNTHPTMRLGSMGTEEVKQHAFFDGINWKKVSRKNFKPIFNPSSSFYRPSRPLWCCGHTSPAAQKHAQGCPPMYRVEVSRDDNGALQLSTIYS